MFPEVERLAVERALACHLLRIVYDASPLVRGEVVLAMGRIILGHSVLFQVSHWLACVNTLPVAAHHVSIAHAGCRLDKSRMAHLPVYSVNRA